VPRAAALKRCIPLTSDESDVEMIKRLNGITYLFTIDRIDMCA
jgi:hypothetical protein